MIEEGEEAMARKKETRKVEIVRFVVEGSGEFPIDMLRYDSCFPSKESESRGIASDRRDLRRVTLEHRGSGQAPTIGRWKSFLWNVVEVDGVAQ